MSEPGRDGVGMSEVHFTRSGDGWIGYRVLDGPDDHTILFLPTVASNVDIMWELPAWCRFWERVSRFAKVIFFDRRGTGVSDGIGDRIAPTLEDWADDALAVMAEVDVEQVSLVAQGLGVAPAVLFAAGRPDCVRSMVLVQGFARLTDAPGYEIGVPESAWVPKRVVDSVERSWGEGSSFFEVHPHLADDPEVRHWIARLERATLGRAAAARAYREWLSVDVRAAVPSVQVPTLVMQATNRFSPVGAGRWLAANLPLGELFEGPFRGSDWWYLDEPDLAVAELERFLTGAVSPSILEDRLLATVLFTDIVDSTATASRMGDQAWHRLLDEHDRIAERVVLSGRGRIVKTTGDGVLATFDAPGRAVRCAVALLESLDAVGLTSRAGLHTGEIELRGVDVAGVAVHLAARIAGIAQGNEVLVSRTIPDLVVGSGIEFVDRGLHELKGIPGQWQILGAKGRTA